MALPAHILKQLPPELTGNVTDGNYYEKISSSPNVLPLGVSELDSALPEGGLLRGAVVEVSVAGAASLASSLGLLACRAAQHEGFHRGGEVPWCAFIDPTCSLYAPGVCQLGVILKRLLVVRPDPVSLQHVAVRMANSGCFSVLVIDTVGVAGSELNVSLASWPRVVRRLSMALEETQSIVLLVTSSDAPRPLTLPVAQRIELCRSEEQKLMLQIAKDRQGRVAAPRSIVWGTKNSAMLHKSTESSHRFEPARQRA